MEEQLTDSLIHAQLLGLVLAVAKEISKGAIPSWQFPIEEFSDLEWVLLKQLILMFLHFAGKLVFDVVYQHLPLVLPIAGRCSTLMVSALDSW